MNIAKVIGRVWATQKLPDLEGLKFLVLQPMEGTGEAPVGDFIVAADSQQAGPGDVVFYVTSKEASFPFERKYTALDAAIVGHVDRIDT
ncbi:MAG: EutN/CcmL family microcompartment protein [Candidatus Marinimicrobia bacterium]|nr:EutN/CcmL family microcompartment protein [Candidatus Neomarinimicrobiota bacterium]